ncbi:MAG TPA: matrixin family metalloprotease [Pyrinomonadaceae bacterium]|nr:matrixin family metalloprotease [Pyrinomonadaceae bacterium]
MKKVWLIFGMLVLTAGIYGSSGAPVPGKVEPQRIRWKGQVIKVAISTSLTRSNPNIKIDSDVIAAIRRSFAAWQDVADIEFQIDITDKQGVSPSGVAGDGVSLITIASTPENVLLFGKDAQTVSAKTRVFFNRKGFITEADIVLNPFQQFSTDGAYGTFDLQSTLTHEIGHLLGLKHSGVLGAAMSENLGKNTSADTVDFESRVLSESDIAAVRDLYGVEDEDCCQAVSGKLTLLSGKAAKNLKVWAEELETGRVMAQVDVDADGNYRLGGLTQGSYKLYWKVKSGPGRSSSSELDTVDVENDELRSPTQKINSEPTKVVLDYIGTNSQLAESAVAVTRGREQTVYLGGKNLDAKSISIDFNSPYFTVVSSSLMERDFGPDISVVSFVVVVDKDAPRGVYSIFAADGNGAKAALVGALKVQ